MPIRLLASLLSLGLFPLAPCLTAEPVGWRTNGLGAYPQATPPKTWAKDKHVVWCAKMPGWSNASPVLSGDKIFVCSEPAILLCVNRKDGNLLWQKEVAYQDLMTPEDKEKFATEQKQAEELQKQLKPLERQLSDLKKKLATDAATKEESQKKIDALKPQVDEFKKKLSDLPLSAKYARPGAEPSNGYSSSTPVTDGQLVYSVCGLSLVACHDAGGNRKWLTLLEKPPHNWGQSASPLLIGDKLIVQIADLVALNVKDGSEAWRAKVPWAWGSPIHAKIGGVDVAITPKGNIVRVSDGKVLAEKLCALEFNAPILDQGVVYFIQNGGKAVKLPEQAADVLKPEVLWTTKPKADRYYASPILHAGLLYAITRANLFSAIDAKTGEVVYEKQLDLGGGTAYPSLALAGNLLYVSSDSGTTLVLELGREYKEVSKNVLESFRCSPVFEGKHMFIRTRSGLYCIGE